ncbi:MAG: hypothetical protein S4CHLAM102_04360 [Chlamydiia bacterium]|nr:hypothetical protein [Chlamydiia bacterium]
MWEYIFDDDSSSLQHRTCQLDCGHLVLLIEKRCNEKLVVWGGVKTGTLPDHQWHSTDLIGDRILGYYQNPSDGGPEYYTEWDQAAVALFTLPLKKLQSSWETSVACNDSFWVRLSSVKRSPLYLSRIDIIDRNKETVHTIGETECPTFSSVTATCIKANRLYFTACQFNAFWTEGVEWTEPSDHQILTIDLSRQQSIQCANLAQVSGIIHKLYPTDQSIVCISMNTTTRKHHVYRFNPETKVTTCLHTLPIAPEYPFLASSIHQNSLTLYTLHARNWQQIQIQIESGTKTTIQQEKYMTGDRAFVWENRALIARTNPKAPELLFRTITPEENS